MPTFCAFCAFCENCARCAWRTACFGLMSAAPIRWCTREQGSHAPRACGAASPPRAGRGVHTALQRCVTTYNMTHVTSDTHFAHSGRSRHSAWLTCASCLARPDLHVLSPRSTASGPATCSTFPATAWPGESTGTNCKSAGLEEGRLLSARQHASPRCLDLGCRSRPCLGSTPACSESRWCSRLR